MKVNCSSCEDVVEFVPSLSELQKEFKELLLDRMQSSTEEEMSAYIDQLFNLVTQAIQSAVDETQADLNIRRAMAARKFDSKPSDY